MASRAPSLSRAEAAALLGESSATGLEPGGWEDFEEYLEGEWQAGQHVSIFAPTEGGKTYLIRHGLLPFWQRYPVLWVRFKPRDRTLAGFGQEVRRFPSDLERSRFARRPADSERWLDDPEHFVLKLPPYHWSADGKKQSKAWGEARRTAGEALDKAFHEGGWVIVIDEVLAFSTNDQPGLALQAPLENLWQRGRDQPCTLIAATQRPSLAPPSMYDQPRWVFLGRTLDVGRHQRISEIGGDTETIKAVLPQLRHQEFLAVDRREGRMWRVKAP